MDSKLIHLPCGISIDTRSLEGNLFTTPTTGEGIGTWLVKLPQVKWVEPAPRFRWFNAAAQWVIQNWEPDNRRIWYKGLTGERQIVSSTDSGLRTSHFFFVDPDVSITGWGDYPSHRKVIAYQPADPELEMR